MPLLSIKNLSIEFPGGYETECAVDDVSFDLEPGEILGLVGETGAGKSTVGNGIVRLLSPPERISGGDIHLDGERISALDDDEILEVRGSGVSFISRHPVPSLSPLFTVGNRLVENITTDLDMGAKQAQTLNLLKDRQDEPGPKFLSISRDLPVSRPDCDRVAIMRRGTILENAETENFSGHP